MILNSFIIGWFLAHPTNLQPNFCHLTAKNKREHRLTKTGQVEAFSRFNSRMVEIWQTGACTCNALVQFIHCIFKILLLRKRPRNTSITRFLAHEPDLGFYSLGMPGSCASHLSPPAVGEQRAGGPCPAGSSSALCSLARELPVLFLLMPPPPVPALPGAWAAPCPGLGGSGSPVHPLRPQHSPPWEAARLTWGQPRWSPKEECNFS